MLSDVQLTSEEKLAVQLEITPYGFKWGDLHVWRLAAVEGRIIVGVEHATLDNYGTVLEIHMTKGGHTMHVYAPERWGRGAKEKIRTFRFKKQRQPLRDVGR